MRNFWYVRIFESVIRSLSARGHSIHLLVEHDPDPVEAWKAAGTALATECPGVTIGYTRRSIDDEWLDLRVMTRLALDYLRFLRPQYAATPILGRRARGRAPDGIAALAERNSLVRWIIERALGSVDRAVPEDPDITRAIEAEKPDVVLVTPLLDLGSDQRDVVRTARRLGVPSALCVGSWDHLSSKSLVRDVPDRVLVWNETQKQEAIELHRLPADRVIVTGAQCFDHWFDRAPALSRDAWCARVGLDPQRPYILYVCSALFEGSPNEASFVHEWIDAVRTGANPVLRDAGILVRPHPKRGFEWDEVTLEGVGNLDGLGNAVLWPARGAAPMDTDTKADYFDSLYHAAAVVGLNTSAMIEAGIVGRPVHTILLPQFADNQEGTLHFHYLLDGGLLRPARDLSSHVVQLGESVAAANATVHHNRAFIERFVRPAGLDSPATPRVVAAVEETARLSTRPVPVTAADAALRWLLAPLARRTSGTFAEQVSRERRYRDRALAEQQRKQTAIEERQARHLAARREKEALKARAKAEKLAASDQLRRDKERQKEKRLAAWHRKKHRQAASERIAVLWRRVVRPFSASR